MEKDELKQLKADAVMKFVNSHIGAYESGFVDQNYCTLQQLYRTAQHHVKDNYGVDALTMKEIWGQELQDECKKDPVAEMEKLFISEISDFYSGFDQLGEPESADQAFQQLISRLQQCIKHAETD